MSKKQSAAKFKDPFLVVDRPSSRSARSEKKPVHVESAPLSDSAIQTPPATASSQLKKKKKKTNNAPEEVSSKRPVSRMKLNLPTKAYKPRDPRFDDMCGDFKTDLFQSSYKFLSEYREEEMKDLQSRLFKEKDDEKKEEIKQELSKFKQDKKLRERKEREKSALLKWKKEERAKQTEFGKGKFYLKKTDQKKLQLLEEFKELKQSGKLTKTIEKKAKQRAAKDHRWMPYEPRGKDS